MKFKNSCSASVRKYMRGGTAALAVCCGLLPFLLEAQTPGLRHVVDIRAEIGASVSESADQEGCVRVTIPITGGSVTGDLNAVILPGGADHQLVDTIRRRNSLCAVYDIMTPDSTVIRVRNEGINLYGDGKYYFVTSPKFECDPASSYAWLMDRIFVCRPVGFGNGEITLRVWEVE